MSVKDDGRPGVPELQDPFALLPEDGASARVAARVTSFARRGGRLPERLARAMAEHGERFVISPPRAAGATTVAPGWALDPVAEFGRAAPLIVEVGAGNGGQVVSAAGTYPDTNFLALEVWVPGIAQTVLAAAREDVANLRVLPADAAASLGRILPRGSVAEVWTFFPDPWRKARHHKRRLVQPGFADDVARVLAPGGVWRLATDWADYAEHARDVLDASPYFARAEGADAAGWAPRYVGRVMTLFERKGLRAGRTVRDLAFVRVGGEVPAAPATTDATSAQGDWVGDGAGRG